MVQVWIWAVAAGAPNANESCKPMVLMVLIEHSWVFMGTKVSRSRDMPGFLRVVSGKSPFEHMEGGPKLPTLSELLSFKQDSHMYFMMLLGYALAKL